MVAPNREVPEAEEGTWPPLPLADWQATHDTLHMWMQIVGKTRLALSPKQNHWWHVPLYVSSRGLTTTTIPYGTRTFEVEFDLIDHRLVIRTSEGRTREIALRAEAVADFYHQYTEALAGLGIVVSMWPVPVEVDQGIPFVEDRLHASYDPHQANRFFRVLMQADRIMKRFQGRFLGKTSPVHFFWGAFDLALTRFNGRRAPDHKDSDSAMLREANSHEEISVGFWPGSGSVTEPAFYAYTRPEPPGLASAGIGPAGAYYSRELGDFILTYELVRAASSPDEMVLEFFQNAYEAGADLARWDRAELDRPSAEWG